MKKILISACVALAATLSVSAQTENNDITVEEKLDQMQNQLDEANSRIDELDKEALNRSIWSRGKYFHFIYANMEAAYEDCPVEKPKFGFGISLGNVYYLHKKPLFNMVKIGLDVMWTDLTVAKMKSSYSDNDFVGDFDPNGGFDDGGDGGFFSNLGRWNMTLGMGIGPIVSVAPFAWHGGNAAKLKCSVYFHYKPSAGVYLLSEDGNTEASWAFCNMFDFGFRATWKLIGVGVEGHWGSGKFKQVTVGEGDNMIGMSDEKRKRKFAATRVYLSLTF